MNFFKTLDVFKVVILLSGLLLPLAVWFAWWADERAAYAQDAYERAVRPDKNGELHRIGALLAQLDLVIANRGRGATSEDHRKYFDDVLSSSFQPGSGFTSNDIQISQEQPKSVGRSKAQDKEVGIAFKLDKDEYLTMSAIHAIVFNCESQGSQIWKLRRLSVQNSAATGGSRSKAPELPLKDDWTVKTMTFARREPKTD